MTDLTEPERDIVNAMGREAVRSVGAGETTCKSPVPIDIERSLDQNDRAAGDCVQ